MTKNRKLYLVRNHRSGYTFGQEVGYKCRLVPRAAALRIAKRLRKSGLQITVSAMSVNVTPEQAKYLDKRYP